MRKKRINQLLQKYIAGTIDKVEKRELQELFDTISFRRGVYPDEKESVGKRMLSRLNNEISPAKTKPSNWKFWWVAAAVSAIIVCATIYMTAFPVVKDQLAAKDSLRKKEIVPGSYVAVLTLGNGKKIFLNSATKGTLAVLGNTIITKNAAGQISYSTVGNNRAEVASSPVTYNLITTPAGGQFKVTLPDGSNVWLNASSSLRYPSRFEGAERHVELQGEGYFEVYKNRNAPFKVTTDKVDIEVLGTHFNVMAYKNEPSVNTTLLEGSVSLSSEKNQKILVPGQQAVIDRASDKILLNTVNVDDAVAWKNGYFSFRKSDIKTAMNKIARWYDVEIEYQGSLNNKILGGTVSRTENIKDLLNYLELTGIAKFKVEGRRVVVICN